jgi:hypothetical protein
MPTVDPGGNFNDEQVLFLDSNGDVAVDTRGPLGDSADLREICVWVFQRRPGELSDLAATEMSTTLSEARRAEDFEQTLPVGQPNRTWRLPAHKIPDGTNGQLGAGPAVAMAIGFFRNHDNDQFKVVQWAQSVVLVAPPAQP